MERVLLRPRSPAQRISPSFIFHKFVPVPPSRNPRGHLPTLQGVWTLEMLHLSRAPHSQSMRSLSMANLQVDSWARMSCIPAGCCRTSMANSFKRPFTDKNTGYTRSESRVGSLRHVLQALLSGIIDSCVSSLHEVVIPHSAQRFLWVALRSDLP